MNNFIDESAMKLSGEPLEFDKTPVKAVFCTPTDGLVVEELTYEEYESVVEAYKRSPR